MLAIAEANRALGKAGQLTLGAWRYTNPAAAALPREGAHDQGVYASIEGPLARTSPWSGWVRAGVADQHAQAVDLYVGGGIVADHLVPGRPGDRIGLAIAHAGLSPDIAVAHLSHAETSAEATYQLRLGRRAALQPDVQYVIAPGERPGARNALAFGLRFVVVAGHPEDEPSGSATDPTVAPE